MRTRGTVYGAETDVEIINIIEYKLHYFTAAAAYEYFIMDIQCCTKRRLIGSGVLIRPLSRYAYRIRTKYQRCPTETINSRVSLAVKIPNCV